MLYAYPKYFLVGNIDCTSRLNIQIFLQCNTYWIDFKGDNNYFMKIP